MNKQARAKSLQYYKKGATMSNKRLYIVFGIMFISLTINGCSQSNDNSSVVPAFSDSVMEIEIPEPEPIEEPDNNLVDNEELEQEINEHTVDDYKPDASGALDDNHDGRGFNLTTGEYEPAFDTNNGQGFDRNGKHYNTKGEYIKAFNEASMSNPDFLTDEELETLVNGGTIMN